MCILWAALAIYVAHNTASVAADALRCVTGFDVEEPVVDLF